MCNASQLLSLLHCLTAVRAGLWSTTGHWATAGSRRPITPCHAFHPYLITPLQAVAVKANGQQSPPSAEDIFITPSQKLAPGSLPGPTLTSVKPWGPTTAQAIATAPVGVAFSQVSGGSIVCSKVNDKHSISMAQFTLLHLSANSTDNASYVCAHAAVQVYCNTCGRGPGCGSDRHRARRSV
jgi:hypothetical protein